MPTSVGSHARGRITVAAVVRWCEWFGIDLRLNYPGCSSGCFGPMSQIRSWFGCQ
jgi:hypothetical protein